MSIRHILFAGAVVLGVSSGTPAGAADVLNLARVRQLAAAGQPQLVAQSAAVQAARETAVAEAQLPDPRLKLGLQNVPVDGFALNREPMTQAMVAVEQMLPGGNKRALRAARAEAEASQMNAELDARRRQIERDAALAFVSLRGAQRQLDVARRLSRESANQVESLAPALRTGKSSQADYYAARTMVTMAHHREAELAAQVGRARADLSRWVGTAAEDALADEPELPLPPPKPLARMLDALERHPEHAMAAQAVGVADAEVALAREAGRPDKSIEIGYGRRARAFADMVSSASQCRCRCSPPTVRTAGSARAAPHSRRPAPAARTSSASTAPKWRALLDEWQRLGTGTHFRADRSSLLPLASRPHRSLRWPPTAADRDARAGARHAPRAKSRRVRRCCAAAGSAPASGRKSFRGIQLAYLRILARRTRDDTSTSLEMAGAGWPSSAPSASPPMPVRPEPMPPRTNQRAGAGEPATSARREGRSEDRPHRPLLARPDGAGPALRQARQVALHGHGPRPGLRGRRRDRRHGRDLARRHAEPRHPDAEVARAPMSPAIEAVGTVAENERAIHVVQARVNGFVEKLHVRANLDAGHRRPARPRRLRPDWVAGAGRVPRAAPAEPTRARRRGEASASRCCRFRRKSSARRKRGQRSRGSRFAHPRAASSRILARREGAMVAPA
jgi:hypothetical protein